MCSKRRGVLPRLCCVALWHGVSRGMPSLLLAVLEELCVEDLLDVCNPVCQLVKLNGKLCTAANITTIHCCMDPLKATPVLTHRSHKAGHSQPHLSSHTSHTKLSSRCVNPLCLIRSRDISLLLVPPPCRSDVYTEISISPVKAVFYQPLPGLKPVFTRVDIAFLSW